MYLYCESAKSFEELTRIIRGVLSIRREASDNELADIRLAFVRLAAGRDDAPKEIPTDPIDLLNLCMRMQAVTATGTPTKKKRGAGERIEHIEEAYKALREDTQAEHIAKWVNNEYDDEYHKMTADNVQKSKSWKKRHLQEG